MLTKPFSEELLPAVARLCRQTMKQDVMPDHLLRENTLEDPEFDPDTCRVVFGDDDDLPIAFFMGVIRQRDEGPVGYVKLLCVEPNSRRQGIAASLYRDFEEHCAAKGVKLIRVYESYPNYFMPGVDPFYTEAVCFFERLGFVKFGDTSNLVADLPGQNFDTEEREKALAAEGITIRAAEEKDKEAVLEWVKEAFPAWQAEVTASFANKPVSLHIAELNGEVKAFSGYEANNKGTGWFGPMGTQKELRGKGTGGILLRRCLKDMKDLGFHRAIIPWVGPIPFYMHYANARVQRVFWRYEKTLG